MPVAGELSGYVARVDKKSAVQKDRQFLDNIYLVAGTMQFNQHPGQEVFTIKYKPGTPVSDKLRKLQYEFGQQQTTPEPTRAEVKKMLDEQVAMAQAQKTELVVAPPTAGSAWLSWAIWALAALVVTSTFALWNQRRRR